MSEYKPHYPNGTTRFMEAMEQMTQPDLPDIQLHEFVSAVTALGLGVTSWRSRKPKSLMHASEGYRRGTKGKKKIMEEIRGRTLDELFEMYWELLAKQNHNI